MRLLGRPTIGGLVAGLLFWWMAATPTMLPRDWDIQAAVSGVSLAVGYLIGTFVGRAPGLLRRNSGRQESPQLGGWPLLAVSFAWVLGIASSAFLWLQWQNEQRQFMGLPTLGWVDALLMVAASVTIGALLVLVGRLVGWAVVGLDRFSNRHSPDGWGRVVTAGVIALVVVVAIGLVSRLGVDRLTAQHAARDKGTEEGILVPDSLTVSGSSSSLVGWDSLGIHGRRFVATATTREQLAAFYGAAGTGFEEPVRAYVGLQSAGSTAERADLAVRELERAGGFDRKVLAVWVPTGSGWMVDEAAAALEMLYRGDTAIVSIQYSFLPSLLTFIIEPGQAEEAGKELYAAVRARWEQLPADQRPQLVVFGMSLGVEGMEAPFVADNAASSVGHMVAGTDGALFVGGPHRGPILSQVTRERDPGSPVWQPVFEGGRSVRFLNRDPNHVSPETEWLSPRIAYLQHPSDPVTFWSLDALWRPPDWMDRPRGFDVPDAATWFPIVSAFQAVADTIQTAPAGFGHVYSNDYVRAWAQVVPPLGWTDGETGRLTDFLDASDYPAPPWGE